MYLHVDCRLIPPTVEVCDQDDFSSLKVVIVTPKHAWMNSRTLAELAGRANDVAWRENLDQMLSYAKTKGWLDDQGDVRAHVELDPAD